MTNNIHFGIDNTGPMYNIHPGIRVIVDPPVRIPNEETYRKGWMFSKNKLPDGRHYGILKLDYDDPYQYKS